MCANICEVSLKIGEILKENKFTFNHRLGQNFITDGNLLQKIVADSGIDGGDTVVEIGTGAGTLTRAIAEKAGKVITFEVDERLKSVLETTLSGLTNVSLVFRDVLKMTDGEITALAGEKFKVVANIPYYITSEIIMRFLEKGLRPDSITLMVQNEVANRLTAKKDTPEYGAITLSVALYGDAEVVSKVSKSMFYPVPKVDSAVVLIKRHNRYEGENKQLLHKLIKTAFAMRRKTLVNNLTAAFDLTRADAESALKDAGIAVMARGETLSLEDLVKLSKTSAFATQGE